ncbi:hypothetical protein DQ04_15741010, partial [Trypanosoma grayi]|uniref:hypothetical protein n=1 Tax=Trypanosoma grayi TaxID=71804 RepID=UPI0004F44E76
MTSTLALNTLVWLKQPGYPWWPGMVLDPAALEMAVPTGYDTCVLCLPSVSSSVAFANSNNAEEILRFNPVSDAALLEAGKQDADCSVAIEEALRVYEQQQEERQKNKVAEEENGAAACGVDNGKSKGGRPGKRHLQTKTDKREKKRHKRRERSESPPAERHRHKKRGGSDEGDNDEDEDEDMSLDDDSDDENGISSGKRGKRGEKKSRRKVSFDFDDQYEEEARRAPSHQEDDSAYFERVLREGRQTLTDNRLDSIRQQLEVLAAACTRGSGVVTVSEAAEEQLLDALSPLARVDVPFEQLRRTRIGVAVGKFLSR